MEKLIEYNLPYISSGGLIISSYKKRNQLGLSKLRSAINETCKSKMLLFLCSWLLFNFVNGQGTEYDKAIAQFTGEKKYDIEKPGALDGIKAPDFTGITLGGNNISLSSLKGKVVVLNFWYIACLPCRIEVKPLNELVLQFKDQKDIVFLSVAADKVKDLKAHLDSTEFLFQTIPDSAYAIANKIFHLFGYPTTLVIDKSGKIRYYTLGGKIKEADVRKEFQEKLLPVIRKCLDSRQKEYEQFIK